MSSFFLLLIRISSFMLIGVVHGGITVGKVESEHKDEVKPAYSLLISACSHRSNTAKPTFPLLRL